ncbi:MAG: SBBP repeat-containing protein [Candidatus Aminicenantes bacterium]|nr:SBBP repeat-containing protein [Candidatus Aminicenantes bacterium]
MRILKSIFVGILLCSPAFFSASDVLRPQDVSQGTVGEVQSASGAYSGTVLGTAQKESRATADLLSYTAGGHVFGFRKGGMAIASRDHALQVKFMNSRGVAPEEKTAVSIPEKNPRAARPLGQVAYNELWDGVTLIYENDDDGGVRSRYQIEGAGAKEADTIGRIGLRYNVPVRVNEAGDLILSFKTGEMRESRPVAWQEIEGRRVPVEVTYDLRGKQEVGFKTGNHDSRYPMAIIQGLRWNIFLGGTGTNGSYGIALDPIGNVYVTGWSDKTWGLPIRPFSGIEWDAFVAKFDPYGTLEWNTFLGGTDDDEGYGIAVDASANIYVTGFTWGTWGSPIRPRSGEYDAFVAKLDTNGNLLWNTFLGGTDDDEGHGIAVDSLGNVEVTGESDATWGSPIHPYSGGGDAFVAKFDPYGTLQWNTFLGGARSDDGAGIAVDLLGNVYVTGESWTTWGSPIRPYSDYADAFVAKLDTYGNLWWNTFVGGTYDDKGHSLAVDASGNVYVTGEIIVNLGSSIPSCPCDDYDDDAFVAKFDPNGALQWNTYLGPYSYGLGLAVDASANVYVTGMSYATWGSPIRSFAGGYDAFVAELDTYGKLLWNTFLGGARSDDGAGIAVDAFGNIYVTGDSRATWGSPILPHSSGSDGFIAKIGKGYNLTIASDPHGTTDPAPGTYSYDVGTTASVSAIADSGYVFDRWTGDVPAGQKTSATVSILMDAPKSIRANFKKVYKLTIACGSHGTTNPAAGTYIYDAGSAVSVSAIADSACVFDRWTGDVPAGQETSATVSILMDADKSIQANFKLVNPPSNLAAARLTNRSVTQTEYIVDLTWAANPDNSGLSITTYHIYQMSGDSWVKIADLSSDVLSYRIRNVPKAEQTFGVASVTAGGVESAKTTVVK